MGKKQFRFLVTAFILLFSGGVVAQQNKNEFMPYTDTIPGYPVTFRMVPIPGGSFHMGSPDKEPGHKKDEGPAHTVLISPFWMEEHEVTYDEFLLFFNDESTSRNSETDAVTRPTPQYIDLSWGMGKQGGFPVNSMSQATALMYCRWLYQKTGVFYRLPTEAEWEYACRAGSSSAYFFGDDESSLGEYAWYFANSNKKYQKVAQKKPNAWGLFDMLGNVAEWTLDQYDENYYASVKDSVTDPCNPPVSTYPRSVRGGGYYDDAAELRCAARSKSIPSWNRRDPQVPKSRWWLTDAMSVGFRIVRPLHPPDAGEIEAFYGKYLGN